MKLDPETPRFYFFLFDFACCFQGFPSQKLEKIQALVEIYRLLVALLGCNAQSRREFGLNKDKLCLRASYRHRQSVFRNSVVPPDRITRTDFRITLLALGPGFRIPTLRFKFCGESNF